MAREQKWFGIYDMAEYLRSLVTGEDVMAKAVTYAKDRRGAMRTFEQGMHTGKYMLVWENGNLAITL